MPSIISGYTYDIFISYRHKDNRGDRWVTEFVNALRIELERTVKEDVSVYFDENTRDGLLETHDVEKSLANKLKCLILIPILSQTYCDTRSYAWNNEFCTFNKDALDEALGRDIKLRNGNSASRILPVAINDLDDEDLILVEDLLHTKLRAVDFIFRSPGVNRPLRKEDTGRTLYRDQINKVANAIKELIDGIKFLEKNQQHTSTSSGSYAGRRTVEKSLINRLAVDQSLQDRSIAVLPFKNFSNDISQEYFADGIAENILIQLAGLRNLRVTSRTSVMRYKKTTKSASTIADELGVKYLLEGSAQAYGDKVRINVQLVDAWQDHHVWAKAFVENLDDIFTIQANVAEDVAKQLHASLNATENIKLAERPTENLEAYDLFLKGRHAFNQWGVEGYRTATDYFEKALVKDPDFKLVYSYLASSYSARMSWNGDLSPATALTSINRYLAEAFQRGATDNDYLTKLFVSFFIEKDFAKAEEFLTKAIELGPNNASVYYTGSYLMCMMGRYADALTLIDSAKVIEPNSLSYFNYYGIYLYLQESYSEAVAILSEGLKLFPQVLRFYDHLARVHLTSNAYEKTILVVSDGLQFAKFRPPSMLAYKAIAHIRLEQMTQADELLTELIDRGSRREKGVSLYVAHVYIALNDVQNASGWMDKAVASNDIDLIWQNVDPLLKAFAATTDFKVPSVSAK